MKNVSYEIIKIMAVKIYYNSTDLEFYLRI